MQDRVVGVQRGDRRARHRLQVGLGEDQVGGAGGQAAAAQVAGQREEQLLLPWGERGQRGVGVPQGLEERHHVGAERHGHVLDLVAQAGQQGAGVLVGGHAVRVHLGALDRVLQRPADPQPARLAAGVAEERLAGRERRLGVHVAGEVAGHHVEQQRRVGDRARERAVDAQAGQVGHERALGDPAAGRLDPEQPADAGRDADGAAAVAALGGRGQARRDRGGGAAARPARRPGQVPRRAGRRADLGLGVAGQPELGGGGLAGDDRAGPLDRDHHVVVGVGHVGLEGLGAQRLPHPGDHVQVLDRDRHAGQRGQRRLVPRPPGPGRRRVRR